MDRQLSDDRMFFFLPIKGTFNLENLLYVLTKTIIMQQFIQIYLKWLVYFWLLHITQCYQPTLGTILKSSILV